MAPEHDLKLAVDALLRGQTILYPTDTIWGIGADATSAEAVEKIFALKQRPAQKSMIVLIADAAEVFSYADGLPPNIVSLLQSFDQPTTFVLPQAKNLGANVPAADGSVGIRVTEDLFCKALIRQSGRPLIATSANLNGQPSPVNFSAVSPEIVSGVGYAVQHRREEKATKAVSRIIRIGAMGEVFVLRA